MKKQSILLLSFSVSLLFVAVLQSCSVKKDNKAPLIDMKDFFKNGNKSTFRISPDGNYFSYRADYKGKMNIFVQKANDTNAIRVTNDTSRSISMYLWKGDRIIYMQDVGGDENFQLFSVKPDGSDMMALTPFPGYRSNLLDDLRYIPGKEKQLLITINKRSLGSSS